MGKRLRTKELAAYFGVSRSSIYGMVARGEIPVLRLRGPRSTLLFNLDEIEQYLRDGGKAKWR